MIGYILKVSIVADYDIEISILTVLLILFKFC